MDAMPKSPRTNIITSAILLLLLFRSISWANPVADPMTQFSTIMVVCSLLGLEAAILTISLLFFGMSPKPVFFATLFGNAAIYFSVFLPTYDILENLFLSELIIVFIEAGFIKLVARFDIFQWDTFRGIGWVGAIVVSTIGNLFSYYVGTIIIS
jgi:hypothetical protein